MSSDSSSSSSPPLHFVLFPFMSKGHIIPLLHIARLLSQRNLSVTIFTTPKNSSFIRAQLVGSPVNIHELPFPQNIEGIPPGVENTGELHSHSKSLFFAFANATISMQPSFELALESLSSPVNCIIYDWFLFWAQDSAEKFGIPTFTFSGMCIASHTLYWLAVIEKSVYSHLPDDEPFSFPSFPNLKLTKNDLDKDSTDTNPDNPLVKFLIKLGCVFRSRGMLGNSFYELESKFHDYWNTHIGTPPAWSIGPLCLSGGANPRTDANTSTQDAKPWLEWLNQKQGCGEHVLYISLGSQAQLSEEQVGEIAKGLEESKVNYLWVLKRSMAEYISEEFEERLNGRGLIVKEWVDQTAVLEHGSVTGFLSHCGWNSVIEAISAGKPIPALPVMAEQHMNARLVEDEFRIGLRIPAIQESNVRSTEVKKMVTELMSGDAGDRARSRVEELRDAARGAMLEGGSSWRTLNHLVAKVHHGEKREKSTSRAIKE